MQKEGNTNREKDKAKKELREGKNIQRTPRDRIDKHKQQNEQELTEQVQGIYGDHAMKQMINNFDKKKIKKR